MQDNLTVVLFRNTYDALASYGEACSAGNKTGMKEVLAIRHQRFCALWSVIEQAGLVEAYEAWKAEFLAAPHGSA